MKVYCYLRVSTDLQDVETQKVGIADFCLKKGWSVDEWTMDEGVSGAVDPSKRKLQGVLKKAERGDVIIFSEISRIGRKLEMILRFVSQCWEKGISVYTVKDRYVLEDSIQSKVLVTVMGLAAEIERDLLRQRTKEGLKRAREAGKILGRPVGRKSSKTKLTGKEEIIIGCLKAGFSYVQTAKKLHVHRLTLRKYVIQRGLENAVVG